MTTFQSLRVFAYTLALLLGMLFIAPLSTHAAIITADTVDTSTDPVVLTGTSTESGATITNIEFQTNGTGGSWTTCAAADGAYDSATEGFACSLGTLTDGDYTIYVRTSANTPLGFVSTTTDLSTSNDYATGVYVDGDNIYIAGECAVGCGSKGGRAFYLYAINKTDGSFVWATTTDPTAGTDQLYGATGDASNIYVTGYCSGCGSKGGRALYTIVYDKTDGSFVWATTTDPTVGTDIGVAPKVDDDYLYIAGTCTGCGNLGSTALYTIVYDKTDGSFVWATTTDITTGSDFVSNAELDNSKFYVSGFCTGCGNLGGYAIFTVAYNKTDGSLVWSTTTDPTAGNDFGSKLAIDDDYLYLASSCSNCGANGGMAYHIAALNTANGSLVWSTTTDPTAGDDTYGGIAVDNENVYVSGICSNCGTSGAIGIYTVALAKSNQAFLWSTTTDVGRAGNPNANELFVKDEILYITGACNSCGNLGSEAFFTLAYHKTDGNTYMSGTNNKSVVFSKETAVSGSGSSGSSASSRTAFLRQHGNEDAANKIEEKYGIQTVSEIGVAVGVGADVKKLIENNRNLFIAARDLGITIPAYIYVVLGLSTPPTASAFTRDLEQGSEGDDVASLQQYLESKGYLIMPQGVVYGYFGRLTQVALIRFQEANGISPTQGYFGPITRGYIR